MLKDKISRKIAEDTKQAHRLRQITFVRDELVKIILAVTGWQSLDGFVNDAIDNIMLGKPVNLVEFNAALEVWRAANLPEVEG